MFRSLTTSHLILRIGLAVVFLWFGAQQILAPDMWADRWFADEVRRVIMDLGMSPRDPVLLAAILEVLVGISLVSGYFVRGFSVVGALLLIATGLVIGWSPTLVGGVGLLAALGALIMWPERTGWHS